MLIFWETCPRDVCYVSEVQVWNLPCPALPSPQMAWFWLALNSNTSLPSKAVVFLNVVFICLFWAERNYSQKCVCIHRPPVFLSLVLFTQLHKPLASNSYRVWIINKLEIVLMFLGGMLVWWLPQGTLLALEKLLQLCERERSSLSLSLLFLLHWKILTFIWR